MGSRSSASDSVPTAVDWMVTVTEPLPDCPSVRAGWERIATQSKWSEAPGSDPASCMIRDTLISNFQADSGDTYPNSQDSTHYRLIV